MPRNRSTNGGRPGAKALLPGALALAASLLLGSAPIAEAAAPAAAAGPVAAVGSGSPLFAELEDSEAEAPEEGPLGEPTEEPAGDETPPADEPAEAPDADETGEVPPPGTAVGPNGEAVTSSPGPATAQPWDGEEIVPELLANGRGQVLGDDYPAKYRNLPWPYISSNIWDEWNFAYRQCTSFVAWRLNNANKVKFSNQYGGLWAWGDAGQWAASARSLGITVNTTPEVGAVAWSGPNYGDASEFGHVAWVAQILDNGNIVIEEYNNAWGGSYGYRTIRPSQFQGYIHIKDISKSFTKTPRPVITGRPMINGTMVATAPAWTPKTSSYSYQWNRNGNPIAGATKNTYSPVLADFGARLTVTTTGHLGGYASASTVSLQTEAVLMPDIDGNGIDDTQEQAAWNTDMNGDGRPDLVGFGANGPYVALATATGYGKASTWGEGFGTATGWTNMRTYPRSVVDVNGDGMADIVGFFNDGVWVSLSNGKGLEKRQRWSTQYGTSSGFSIAVQPRTLVDLTGDGLPEIVAFGTGGIDVAVNTGKGFASATKWYLGFGTEKGWTTDGTLRYFEDMNNDGLLDVVGFTQAGVFVALNTGKKFSTAKLWTSGFGGSSGWKTNAHPRSLADVNGDGRPDVVGFANDGVYVALNTGAGLGAVSRWNTGFGSNAGWRTGMNSRVVVDVNGDGKADVVGLSGSGMRVALSTGKSFKAEATWSSAFKSAAWSADLKPLRITDATGDGKADIVAYDDDGVKIAASTGTSFAAPVKKSGSYGKVWKVEVSPRAVTVQQLSIKPTPKISGEARVGQTLTGAAGSWQPAPVSQKLQWLRDGAAIAGATKASYELTPQDYGAKVSLRVSAAKPAFVADSRASAALDVAKGALAPQTPVIEGTPKRGATLTARTAAWGPGNVALRHQWLRGGKPIAGAAAASYKLTAADVGRRLTVTVTGTLDAYEDASRTSAMVRVPGTPELPAASPFADVSTKHKFYKPIAWMATTEMSTGTAQPTGKPKYLPKDAVSREAMAAFLFRLAAPADYAAPKTSPFVDVPVTHKFYREIAWMHSSGLSTGTKTSAGLKYDPRAEVSRAAMAAFLYRLEQPKYTAPAKSHFTDVAKGKKFYREISWMWDSGLSTGVKVKGGSAYKGNDSVSREAMAAFLYRLETRPPNA